MNAILIRNEFTPTCVLGVLVLDNGFTCQTLELPWRNNERNVSCIPLGTYEVSPWLSPSKGDCFKVHDVPARDDILLHVGNYPKDSQGCVLVGQERGVESVMLSRLAMNQLEIAAPDGFTLTIQESR